MKKFIKIIGVLMSLSLVFGLVSCSGDGEVETTTQAAETTQDFVEEVTDSIDTTTSQAEDSTAAVEDTTVAEEETTVTDETTEAMPAADMSKAEFVAFLNAETAKIAKSGTYSVNRVCEYTDPVDVGGATDVLNNIITAIDKNSDLNSVVGAFIGIGTTTGNVPADEIDSDYMVKASVLKEADLGSFTASNGVYTFTLASATNPQKDNTTSFSRYTNDFFTLEEVVTSIAEFTSAIKVTDATADYTDIKVEVTVVEGKITNMSYTYNLSAVLNLKAAFVPITGTGAGVCNAEYTNIKY